MAQEQTHALAVELRTTRLPHRIYPATPRGEHRYYQACRHSTRLSRARDTALIPSLRAFATLLSKLGAEHITLQVSVDNGPALICFENAGFRYLGYTETSTQAYTMGIERNVWEGDEPIDEESASPRLSAPLKAFFDE